MSTRRGAIRNYETGPSGSDVPASENSETIKLLFNKCMRWVLLAQGQGNTFKSSDIMAYLKSESHNVSRKDFQIVYEKIKTQLLDTFGLKIVEVKESGGNVCYLHSIYSRADVHLDETNVYDPLFESLDTLDLNEDEGEDDDDADDDNERMVMSPVNDEMPSIALPNAEDEGIEEIFQPRSPEQADENVDDDDDDENNVAASLIKQLPDNVSPFEFVEECKNGLIFSVLAFIFVNDCPLPEAVLMERLSSISLDPEEKIVSFADNKDLTIKKLIADEFCRRHYLKRIKVPSEDPSVPPTYSYEWGKRAMIEFSTTGMLEFIKRIYGEKNPSLWHSYEQRSKEMEEKRMILINGEATEANAHAGGTANQQLQVVNNEDNLVDDEMVADNIRRTVRPRSPLPMASAPVASSSRAPLQLRSSRTQMPPPPPEASTRTRANKRLHSTFNQHEESNDASNLFIPDEISIIQPSSNNRGQAPGRRRRNAQVLTSSPNTSARSRRGRR